MRQGGLKENEFQRAKSRLQVLLDHAYEIIHLEKVKSRAARLLEVHPLKAANACQLAAALVVTQEDPARVKLITFDQRLMTAAKKEGFSVNP
jgi:predicted nucleic acid-binding protein